MGREAEGHAVWRGALGAVKALLERDGITLRGDVLRYFDIAAPLHHEDEELHVFPLLLARGAPSVVALVRQLQQDHVHMAVDWAAARGALAALADGSAAGLSAQDEALLDQFAQRYGQHIQAEEGTAYPSAQALLGEGDLRTMGLEMAGRRRAS